MKKNIFIKLFVIVLFLVTLTACSNEKTYKNEGISITMTKGLFYKQHETADIYYENNEIFVIGLKEKFEDLYELDINNKTTIEEYVDEIFLNRQESFELIKDENLYYYTYEYEVNDNTYYYVSTIHKGKDGFWICNFACNKNDKEKYHDLFIKWGKTITLY